MLFLFSFLIAKAAYPSLLIVGLQSCEASKA